MEFQSIEEVTKKLRISAEHPEDIRREVRRRLLEVHPDALAGAGLPEDAAKREEALLLTAALNFLNKPAHSTDIAPRETETELIRLVRDLVQVNRDEGSQSHQQEIVRREREAEQRLSQRSAARVQEVKSAGRVPIIGLGSVTVLLSALWFFPMSIQENLILGHYVNPLSPLFAAAWFCCLCATAASWLFFKWRTEEEALFQRTLNLHATQNMLFHSFLSAPRDFLSLMSSPSRLLQNGVAQIEGNWFYQKLLRDPDDFYALRDAQEIVERLRFTSPKELQDGELRSDLTRMTENLADLTHRFFGWSDQFRDDRDDDYGALRYFDKGDFVIHIEAKSTHLKSDIARSKRRFLRKLFFFFARIPIEAEQAQNVADLILTRGEANGVLTKVDSSSLDERYSLKTVEDDQKEQG